MEVFILLASENMSRAKALQNSVITKEDPWSERVDADSCSGTQNDCSPCWKSLHCINRTEVGKGKEFILALH